MATVRRWNLSRVGITQVLNLLRLVGEAAWLYPWSLAVGVWFGGAPRPLLEVPTLFAVLLVAAAGTQGTVRVHGHPGLARGVLIGLGAVVACLVALSQIPVFSTRGGWTDVWELLSREGYRGRAITGAAMAIFLWWRGITVGRSWPSSWNIEGEFRTGILAMAGLLVVALAGENARASSNTLLLSVIALVFSGLVGMPLARVADESEHSGHADSPGLSPGGPWLTMLLGIVGIVLLVTLILAQLLTFQRLDLLFQPLLGLLETVLWALIYIVALPVGLLASVVIYLGRLLIGPGGAQAQLKPPDMSWLDDLRQQNQAGAVAPELLLVLKVGLAVLLGLVLVGILVQAVRRLSDWWDDDDVEEVRGFLSCRPGLQELLRWLLHRLRPIRPRVLEGCEGQVATAGATDGVRGLYREFLSLGVDAGHGRRPHETPREYQRRLGQETQHGAAEVDLITESYNLARYAAPESWPPDTGPVAAALARLRILWRHWLARELPSGPQTGATAGGDQDEDS